jgi:hypothetical protein
MSEAAPAEDLAAPIPAPRALDLLQRRDFRRVYLAVSISKLGDAFHYIALMWLALEAGGPLGVVAVRLADSLPAFAFGFHGGLVADRRDRRGLMVASDLARAAVLVPLAVAGLSGELPLAALVVAAFLLTAAASYFDPAYGALLPMVVERRNVQQANALVRATADVLSVAGWAAAAALLTFVPLSAFFAFDAASFVLSALCVSGMRIRSRNAVHDELRVREGLAAVRGHAPLAVGIVVLGIAVTISSGTWIAGVPDLVRDTLGRGAGSFSLVAAAYAVGSIAAGVALARKPVRRKVRAGLFAWALYLPAYGAFALADSLELALAGGFGAGIAQTSAVLLLTSAAQEQVADRVLGRVMGLIALTHRGAHATGLLFVAPLFALASAPAVFAGAAIALPAVGLVGALLALRRGAGHVPSGPSRRYP